MLRMVRRIPRKKGSWDRGIDYNTAYSLILRHINRPVTQKSRAYAAVALVQLRNGSRVSEAVRAVQRWLQTGESIVEVPLSKNKKPRTRQMVIPREVEQYRDELVWLLQVDEKKLIDRVKYFCLEHLGFSSHSLRYAYVTYLAKNNVPPTIIAKITGHRNLSHLITYTEQKEAEQVLKELG